MRGSNQFAEATSGVVYIHSSPAALCPHVEWALSDALDCRANLKWSAQPASDGQLRATTDWIGPVGTGATLAGILRSWQMLRFEVTEDPSEGVDGERFSHVPVWGCGVDLQARTVTWSSARCVCEPSWRTTRATSPRPWSMLSARTGTPPSSRSAPVVPEPK